MRSLQEAAKECGVTYRQAHHWVSQGWVEATPYAVDRRSGEARPRHALQRGRPGSGCLYMLEPEQVRLLCATAQVHELGFPPARAARLARLLIAGAHSVRLDDNLVLLYEPEGDYDADASL